MSTLTTEIPDRNAGNLAVVNAPTSPPPANARA